MLVSSRFTPFSIPSSTNLSSKISFSKNQHKYSLLNETHFTIDSEIGEWVQRSGGEASKVFVGFPNLTKRRGLFTKDKVKKDEVLLRIPHDFVLMKPTLQNTPFGSKLPWGSNYTKRNNPYHDYACCIAMYLLHEQYNVDSPLKPWIERFPKSFRTALDLNETHVRALLNTTAGYLAMQMRDQYANIWNDLLYPLIQKNPQHFPKHMFTHENFTRAFKVHFSRSISSDLGPMMVPVIDFANHPDKEGDSNSEFALESEGAELKATRDLEPYVEVFMDYGPKSNPSLWVTHGFTQQKNKNEELILKILFHSLDLTTKQYSQLPDFFTQNQDFFGSRGAFTSVKLTSSAIDSLLPAVRSFVLWKRNKTLWDIHDCKQPILQQRSLEEEACRYSQRFLLDNMARFETGENEDKEAWMLESEPIMMDVLLLRMEEKKLLTKYVQQIREYLNKLSR